MNLDHDFVQVWKFSEDQRKVQTEHFFSPNSGEDQKKVFSKNRTLFLPGFRWKPKKKDLQQENNTFFPKFTLRCTPFQIIGGMQKWTFLKLLGGYSQIIGGIYSPPPPPGFGTTVPNPWFSGK